MQIIIDLTLAEEKAISSAMPNTLEWADYTIKNRCRIAIDEIVQLSVTKCLEVGLSIPNSREEIVDLAFSQGWVKTAAQRIAEEQENAQAKIAEQTV
jgi:hypothetical protein